MEPQQRETGPGRRCPPPLAQGKGEEVAHSGRSSRPPAAARATGARLTHGRHALWSPPGPLASQTSASVLMDSLILRKHVYLTGKFISMPNMALINKHSKSKATPLNLCSYLLLAFSVKNRDLQESGRPGSVLRPGRQHNRVSVAAGPPAQTPRGPWEPRRPPDLPQTPYLRRPCGA